MTCQWHSTKWHVMMGSGWYHKHRVQDIRWICNKVGEEVIWWSSLTWTELDRVDAVVESLKQLGYSGSQPKNKSFTKKLLYAVCLYLRVFYPLTLKNVFFWQNANSQQRSFCIEHSRYILSNPRILQVNIQFAIFA